MNTPPSPDKLWAVVRDNRDFQRLYSANAISLLGDWSFAGPAGSRSGCCSIAASPLAR